MKFKIVKKKMKNAMKNYRKGIAPKGSTQRKAKWRQKIGKSV
jgi:hypothetical protein